MRDLLWAPVLPLPVIMGVKAASPALYLRVQSRDLSSLLSSRHRNKHSRRVLQRRISRLGEKRAKHHVSGVRI